MPPALICLSHLRWDFVYQRPNHLMARAARDRDVYFVEEPLRSDPGPRLEIFRDRAITHREVQSACTTVHFAAPAEADLRAYVADGEPLRVAGGFTLDGLGGWFVDGIEGDPSNVIGVSLPLLRELLGRAGLSVASLWESRR